MSKQNVLENIANQVIEMMETHGASWTKPWTTQITESGAPRSALKRKYTGINSFVLGWAMLDNGWTNPHFATFKQWKSVGANVKKGAKGTAVVFWKQLQIEDKDTGEKKTIPMLRHFTVFNFDQVENADLSKFEVEQGGDTSQQWDDHVTAEQLIAASGATIKHKAGDDAYFSPAQDLIVLPRKEQFKDAQGYYGTALHELTHWTGHESRLARTFGKRFGDEKYAAEELVAELGAAMLCGVTGVSPEPRHDHAGYLNSWIKAIKKDPRALMTAMSMAEKAAQFLLDQCEELEAVA